MDVSNWMTLCLGLLSGLGIGSIATSFIQHFLHQRESNLVSQRTELENRYKVIILLMYAVCDFEANLKRMSQHRPDLNTFDDVMEELKAEWHNMLLFASQNTQSNLHSFIKNPTFDKLKMVAISMRRDLGRGKLDQSINALNFS